MAMHELATNAVKYGALSTPEGRVAVHWRVEAETPRPMLALEWRESGGPPVIAPARRGFGSRLIERGLARELDGECRLVFDKTGVTCRFHLPLSGKLSLAA
jgi:two-component sensor histidine kinase